MDAVREEGAATPPTSTSLPYSLAQPPQCSVPARAPCHRESLPEEDESEQEDEEAGGEEQFGWEGRKRWFRHRLQSSGPWGRGAGFYPLWFIYPHPRSSRCHCRCRLWHTGPSRCRKTGGSGLGGMRDREKTETSFGTPLSSSKPCAIPIRSPEYLLGKLEAIAPASPPSDPPGRSLSSDLGV